MGEIINNIGFDAPEITVTSRGKAILAIDVGGNFGGVYGIIKPKSSRNSYFANP